MPLPRAVLWIVAAATLAAGLATALHPVARALATGRLAPGEITVAAAAAGARPTLWIDARTADRFAAGSIPGALPLDVDRWDEHAPALLARWQPGTRLVVFCDSARCDRSHEVAQRLRRDFKLPDVWILHGGWEAWRAAAPRP